MARDLNKFFADHRKSHTRYISSVDSLIERYEDDIDDELDSVVNLSSCKIVKDKKDIFRRGRFFGTASHPFHFHEKHKDYTVVKGIEEAESMLPTEEEDEDLDTRDMDFRVLKDMSTCVASFLEEGEPEPSDAETLSSTSTDSYETILSNYEDDTTQETCSQEEDLDFKQTDNHGEDDDIYDETDGSPHRKTEQTTGKGVTDLRKNFLPYVNREYSERGDTNNKNPEKRFDETFVIENHSRSNTNRIAVAHDKKKWNGNVAFECNNNSLVDNYNIRQCDVNRLNLGHDVPLNSLQGKNARRISTQFIPFNELDRDYRREKVSGNNNNDKEQVCINKNYKETAQEDLFTESSLFSEDSRYPDASESQRHEIKNKIQLEINKLDSSEHSKQRNEAHMASPRNNLNWLDRNFSPRHTSEQIRSPGNDLSPSHRRRGSQIPNEKHNEKGSVRRSKSDKYLSSYKTEMAQIVTPLHHRQARKMMISKFQSSPLPKDETFLNDIEVEQEESLQEDNRSSKKDSGFSTLHDESLTIDTPLHADIPEVLTLENLDSFNKSLAEHSTFINVSVNCSDSKSEEKTEKVEKWLHNVSVEMEKESETSIDRKVNRISQEICRKFEEERNDNDTGTGSRKHRREVNRQRHSSAEMAKESVAFFETVVSKSCQPLKTSQRLDMNQGTGRDRAENWNTQNMQKVRHRDRHTLKVHRNLNSQFCQRLNDEQVAELMKMFARNEDRNIYQNEVGKRKYSEFSGERFVDQYDEGKEIGNKTDAFPTPPKSRKLNENFSDPFKQKYERKSANYLNRDRHYKSPGYRKSGAVVDNYIEKDDRIKYSDDKHEMLAYMMQRNIPKKSPKNGADRKQVRNSGKKDVQSKEHRENFPNEERTKDSHYRDYQNIYHEIEYDRDEISCTRYDNSLQRKMKSPNNEHRLLKSPENRSSHRDQRNVRMQNACISPVNRYEVNQSYIRKLKHDHDFEETDNGLESQQCCKMDKANEEIYETNDDSFDRRDPFDIEHSPRMKGRHARRQSYKRSERNESDREHDLETNQRENIFERFEKMRKECEYQSTNVDSRQYRPASERCKPESRHYVEIERDNAYDRPGSFEQFEDSSPRARNSIKKSSDRFTNPKNHPQDEFNERHANFRDAHGVYSELPIDNEAHGYEKIPDRKFIEDEEVFRDDFLSPRTRMRQYHLECHLGSPHWQRTKHSTEHTVDNRSPRQQRNSNAARRDNMSPTISRTGSCPKDTGFRSPSTRYNTEKKYEDFSSPTVQKVKACSSNRQDEFSPSTSLAKMRLNTPKSRSEDRQRQHRRSESRGEDFETNVAQYQEPYDQSEIRGNNSIEKCKISSLSKKVSRKSSKNIRGQLEDLDADRERRNSMELSPGNCYQADSPPRFVSLDQIRGMPLQLRIQQLESRHTVTGDRPGERRADIRNMGCSNQYICEQSSENSEYYENEQRVDSSLESDRNSNVYHKYCKIINERGQEGGQSPAKDDTDVDRNEQSTQGTGKRIPVETSEPKVRKSLFSPTYANIKQKNASHSKKALSQTGIGYDVFKIPMSPPVVNRNKLNKHNKENEHEHDENKAYQQKITCSPVEATKTRETFSNKFFTKSARDKMTGLQFMQSTPIKPGIQFSLNTTMSTIMGSDETEINNDQNEEIVLISN